MSLRDEYKGFNKGTKSSGRNERRFEPVDADEFAERRDRELTKMRKQAMKFLADNNEPFVLIQLERDSPNEKTNSQRIMVGMAGTGHDLEGLIKGVDRTRHELEKTREQLGGGGSGVPSEVIDAIDDLLKHLRREK